MSTVIIRRIGYTPATIAGNGAVNAARYTKSFNATTDWTLQVDDYVIEVSVATHDKGTNPTIVVYMDNTITFEEVVVPVTVDALGNIKIYVTSTPDNRFIGKLLVI